MLEARVESALTQAVTSAGGWPLKLGLFGLPDRLCILPGPRFIFVELKRPRGKPRALQAETHKRLRALGCDVRVIDTPEAARAVAS